MAKENLITSENLGNVQVREIDFVSQFNKNIKHLTDILGIMRPVKKENGAVLKSYKATCTLANGKVAEGEEIPLSKITLQETTKGTVELEKYSRQVTAEAVMQYGAENAIIKTDKAFMNELQNKLVDKLYKNVQNMEGATKADATSFTGAIAKALGNVRNECDKLGIDSTEVVVMCNILDFYNYLGDSKVTVQNQFGLTYVEGFMGAKAIVLTSRIEAGHVVATPSNNLVLYYVDPASEDFKALGLEYTTEGNTSLIGFHVGGNYNNATGTTHAITGTNVWAEYSNLISNVTVKTELGA